MTDQTNKAVLQAWLAQQFMQELRNNEQFKSEFANALDRRTAGAARVGDMHAFDKGDAIVNNALVETADPAADEQVLMHVDPEMEKTPAVNRAGTVTDELGKTAPAKVARSFPPIKGRRR